MCSLVSSACGIQPCDFLSGSADPYVVVNQGEGKNSFAQQEDEDDKESFDSEVD
jgi:hypothetical protein